MRLTPVYIDALTFSAQLHLAQMRKGSGVPYLAHVLGVGAIVLEYGGTEDDGIAALLHDAVEDQGGKPVLARIRERFGPAVADIVEACSDTDVVPKPPWKERKLAYVAHLRTASPGAKLVSAADKLHNSRAILADYRTQGEALWGRFNGGRDGTLWYYRAVVEALLMGWGNPIIGELDRVVTEIERLAAAELS
jgi:(p)ppGpp synthase/HD superfamily hydrolase